jgi:hypothetical protein
MHQPDALAGLITRDPGCCKVCRTIEKVAGSNATVLLLGESGTGKELLARGLHQASPRKGGKFVAINCAAIPENLLESELFGYEKGAFTGAAKMTLGKIETANGGTLMLDEIGDLPFSLQAKLLRFLQERTIERIGGRQEIPVDVRIVCATHQDLKALIKAGRFREDLYYRLAEIVIDIPPLRERVGDPVLLAHAFARRFAQENKTAAPDAERGCGARHRGPCLARQHPRAGELHQARHHHGRWQPDHARRRRPGCRRPRRAFDSLDLRTIRDSRREERHRRRAGRVNGNMVKAAELLGISRPTLVRFDAPPRPQVDHGAPPRHRRHRQRKRHGPHENHHKPHFPRKRPAAAALLAWLLAACGGEKAREACSRRHATTWPRATTRRPSSRSRTRLQENPELPEARLLLGLALLKGGDPVGAEPNCARRGRSGHPDEQVVPPLAQAMLMLGKVKNVLEDLPPCS